MSEHTDSKNNTYKIINTVRLTEEEKEQAENEIVEELYKIFLNK